MIADKVDGLFLGFNTVNFSTNYTCHSLAELGRFEVLFRAFADLQMELLARVHSFIDAETIQYVASVHPQFHPFILYIKNGQASSKFLHTNYNNWGEVLSLHRDFVAHTLRYILRCPGVVYARAESQV
jgi:hypothetical protein